MSKKSFELEFGFKASPTILYEFIITASGLSQWFADSVDVQDGLYTFEWSGSEEQARLLESIEDELVRYQWINSDENEYFEFRIGKSEVTSDTILKITDFAEDYDIKDQKMLWENQVAELQKRIGG